MPEYKFLILSDFSYTLPKELIAQTPLPNRSDSRMLVLSGTKIIHEKFENITDYINKNDCLIFNNSRVIHARLFGEKNGAPVEILLLKELGQDIWECLVRPGRKCKKGSVILFSNSLEGEIIDETSGGNRLIKFKYNGIFNEILDTLGQIPLPPYITEKLDDKERYQTVYAKEKGSAAAPTAGLHFSNEILNKLKQNGVSLAFLTLHVGLGTFRPVKVKNIAEHTMHSEHFEISSETIEIIKNTRNSGGRIIAVGTTSARVLETVFDKDLNAKITSGSTDIFIYPGYNFKTVDCLLTNFHLPESTLLMLVSALSGRENILNAYNEAIKEKYRFFSFGDCMFII